MKHPPKKAIVLVLLLVVGVVLFTRKSHTQEDPNLLVGSGTVEAESIGLSSKSVGRLALLRVEEGDKIVAGQVIAELESDAQQAEQARARAAVTTAQAQLNVLLEGSRDEEIRARAAAVREAAAALDGARQLTATARAAYLRPTAYTAQYDQAAAQLKSAEAALQQARAAQKEAVNGPRPQELDAARAAVAQADAAIKEADAAVAQSSSAAKGADAELTQAEVADRERQAAKTGIERAESELAAARARLAQAEAARAQVNDKPRPDRREQVQQQIAAAEAASQLAEQELQRVKTLYDSGAIARKALDAAEAAQRQAQANLRQARAALADLDAGATQHQRGEADAAVNQAQAAVRGAEDALANARHEDAVLKAGTRQQLERARTAAAQAKDQQTRAQSGRRQAVERKAQAQAQLDLLQSGTRAERLEQAAAQVKAAEASRRGALDAVANARQAKADRFDLQRQYESAQQSEAMASARYDQAAAQLDLAIAGATDSTIQAARGQLEQAQAAVQLVGTQLEDTVIRAPQAGVVTEVVLRAGEAVSPGSVVVRMIDSAHQWVRVYLPVTAFGRVQIGQTAHVRWDGQPDKAFDGRVSALSDEAEFTPKNTQTVEQRVKQVFWVKVDIGDGGGILKPGLPVDVTIDAGVRP